MTRDIDLGVEVAGRDQFNQLKASLVTGGKLSQDEREPQRLHCGSLIIDIVPFGPIADKDIRISWPPEHEVFVSLLGFEEAFKYSCSSCGNTKMQVAWIDSMGKTKTYSQKRIST